MDLKMRILNWKHLAHVAQAQIREPWCHFPLGALELPAVRARYLCYQVLITGPLLVNPVEL